MADHAVDMVDFFLRNNCSAMTVRELADATGLSRSTVDRRLKKLGLKSAGAPRQKQGKKRSGTSGTKQRKKDGEKTDLERLEELRDILHFQMKEANASNLPRIAAEYRATISEIAALNGEENGDDDDGFDGYL